MGISVMTDGGLRSGNSGGNPRTKRYFVMGYKRTYNYPTVNMLGMYSNIEDAEKRQLELCGGKKRPTFSSNDSVYGANGFCSWIHEVTEGDASPMNFNQPSRKGVE